MSDTVNHPPHYQGFSNGAEVIDITENLSFNLGNVVKYVSRAGRKTDNPIEDLKKAQFYLNRELDRLAVELGHFRVAEKNETLEAVQRERERRWNIIFGGDPEDIDWLPLPLREQEGIIWVDKDGDEWRWQDDDREDPGWGYRTPKVTGWIPIKGSPSAFYAPYTEKTYD